MEKGSVFRRLSFLFRWLFHSENSPPTYLTGKGIEPESRTRYDEAIAYAKIYIKAIGVQTNTDHPTVLLKHRVTGKPTVPSRHEVILQYLSKEKSRVRENENHVSSRVRRVV